jgi:hypothetical protein
LKVEDRLKIIRKNATAKEGPNFFLVESSNAVTETLPSQGYTGYTYLKLSDCPKGHFPN